MCGCALDKIKIVKRAPSFRLPIDVCLRHARVLGGCGWEQNPRDLEHIRCADVSKVFIGVLFILEACHSDVFHLFSNATVSP